MNWCPDFCSLPHHHSYQHSLAGPSRPRRNGHHHGVAPYPNQIERGSLRTVPRNHPIGTHPQMGANHNPGAGGGIQGTPPGLAPTIVPAPNPPRPIRPFTQGRAPRRPPTPRDDPQIYEVLLVPPPPPPVLTGVTGPQAVVPPPVPPPAPPAVIPPPLPPPIPPTVVPSSMGTTAPVSTASQSPITPATASSSAVPSTSNTQQVNYWANDDKLDWGDD